MRDDHSSDRFEIDAAVVRELFLQIFFYTDHSDQRITVSAVDPPIMLDLYCALRIIKINEFVWVSAPKWDALHYNQNTPFCFFSPQITIPRHVLAQSFSVLSGSKAVLSLLILTPDPIPLTQLGRANGATLEGFQEANLSFRTA